MIADFLSVQKMVTDLDLFALPAQQDRDEFVIALLEFRVGVDVQNFELG